MDTLISPLARQAIMAGRKDHRPFWVVDPESMRDGWRLDYVEEIPERARKSFEVLKRAKIPYGRIIFAHEAPRLLTAPKDEPKNRPSIPALAPWVADLAAVLIIGMVMIFGLALRVMLLDPAVLVELPTGEVLLVARWYA